MKKNRWIVWLICLLAIALTLALGSMLPRSWHYLTSTLMILELLVPFFLAFEGRKPQARELVLIAVLCALAVAGRVAIPIPNFKAIFAIIMITGIAFGPETGFLVGAVSALTSNFFYSQGPFTPWQMLAYGMGGMVFGLLFRRLPRKPWLMAVFGFAGVLLVVCPLLDTCTLVLSPIMLNLKNILAVYTVSLPMNLIQAGCTAAILLLLGKPLLEKLHRIQTKYGLLSGKENP